MAAQGGREPVTLTAVQNLMAQVQAMATAALETRKALDAAAGGKAVDPPPTVFSWPPPPTRLRAIHAIPMAAVPVLEGLKEIGDALLRASAKPVAARKQATLLRKWFDRESAKAVELVQLAEYADLRWDVQRLPTATSGDTSEAGSEVATGGAGTGAGAGDGAENGLGALAPAYRVRAAQADACLLHAVAVSAGGGVKHGRWYTGHTSFSWNGDAPLAALDKLAASIAAIERSDQFRLSLLEAQATLSASTSFTPANFAYGCTPVSSFLKVLRCPAVARATVAIRNATATTLSTAIVFGSSLGLLAFSMALMADVAVVGYELVGALHQHATRLCDSCAATSRLCTFVHGDMLEADVSTAGLIVLTSQCWDKPLITATYRKLLAELPPKAVVVDYREPPKWAARLTVAHRVVAPVSWNAAHTFYVSVVAPPS